MMRVLVMGTNEYVSFARDVLDDCTLLLNW